MLYRTFAFMGMALLASGTAAAQGTQPAAQPMARTVFIANMDIEFRKMDADKNGTLTRLEIEQFQRATSILQIQQRNRAAFARLDKDRNGQLSPAEFAALQTAAPPASAAPMLGRFDSNRDQAITLVEFRTGTLVNFDKMDSDKDGVVSPAEMRAGQIIK